LNLSSPILPAEYSELDTGIDRMPAARHLKCRYARVQLGGAGAFADCSGCAGRDPRVTERRPRVTERRPSMCSAATAAAGQQRRAEDCADP